MIIPRPSQPFLCLVLLLFGIGCNRHTNSQETVNSEVNQQKDTVAEESRQVLLFFGNSLTAGYGVEPEKAFPYLIQQRLDSLGLPYNVVNAGLSGETSASGVNRIEWVLREEPAVMILELGGNDGLRGIDPNETRKNLEKIINLAQGKYPDLTVIIAGMEAPPNMGQDYISSFRAVFKELADEKDLPLIPFLLQGVGGEQELNLPDGIHPNEQGHKIVANNVWAVLKKELRPNSHY